MIERQRAFLEEMGLHISATTGDELVCDCVCCGKEEHLHVNLVKSVFHCKYCGESGRYPQLVDKFASLAAEEVTRSELRRLSRDRNLPVSALRNIGLGYTGRSYTLPVRNRDGGLTDLRRFRLGGKWTSAPGLKTGLYRAELLGDSERADEPVYVCEGEHDAIALEHVRRRVKQPGIVVAVPGANTFKTKWADWLRGRKVILAYDNDEAGGRGERRATRLLSGRAKSLLYFQWRPDDADGMDLRDLIGGAL